MSKWEKNERDVLRSRCTDQTWNVARQSDGYVSYEAAQLAVMQDIRDELKKLNAIFHCSNALEIPTILRQIRRNTTKHKAKRK
jgi:hypothetical protein